MYHSTEHKFHIPVMGLAYTIDSPIKVARFGIASVISIVEDRLIEAMRSYYYPIIRQQYHPITIKEEDCRARRITDYLNLVNRIVQEQVEKLKRSAFETGSEIVKYFKMLPDNSKTKQLYRLMMITTNKVEKENIESILRTQIIPGAIDVNIMTKVDMDQYDKDGRVREDDSKAISALRGYAKSDLSNSTVVFSAGMNPRLYNYLEKFSQFDADVNGRFQKKIAIKVSDFRSALIQGKYLAKKGIWVSEFRIESGLNCGGHAFATNGHLMGPILEEFKTRRSELIDCLFEMYNNAIKLKGRSGFSQPHPIKISAQGGIGTFEEDDFLHTHYGVDSTGWGTPFLVVPEATTVDEDTLNLLCRAKKDDVVLSGNSPLGVRFHYLKGTSSDLEKRARILNGKPGSPCTEKYLSSDTEFTEKPICTASRKYQKLKIAQLQTLNLPGNEHQKQIEDVLKKECLCIGLSNAAAKVYKVPFVKKLEAVTICPGPNIAYFSKVVTLQRMTDHIYGRTDLVADVPRPHMFIAELGLYINYLKEQWETDAGKALDGRRKKYYREYYNNLMNGINYYRHLPGLAIANKEQFYNALCDAEKELDEMHLDSIAHI